MRYFLQNYFIYWFYIKRVQGPTATAMRRKRFVRECYSYATTDDRREDRPAIERLTVPKHAFERRIAVAYLHAFHWSKFGFLLVFLTQNAYAISS